MTQFAPHEIDDGKSYLTCACGQKAANHGAGWPLPFCQACLERLPEDLVDEIIEIADASIWVEPDLCSACVRAGLEDAGPLRIVQPGVTTCDGFGELADGSECPGCEECVEDDPDADVYPVGGVW